MHRLDAQHCIEPCENVPFSHDCKSALAAFRLTGVPTQIVNRVADLHPHRVFAFGGC